MSDNTKNITIKGLFWNALDRFGNQAIVTVVGIITARVISSEDFGVIGVLMIFSTIATAFVDSGLATSLVRTKQVNELDYSSMFVFNLWVAGFLYLILFFSAPYIEEYYAIPNLTLYARVLFLQLLVHSLGIVQYVKILKNFQFKITARINVIAIFLSGIVVVLVAVLGFGIWALLLQQLLYSFFRTIMLWYWGDWKVSLKLSYASLKQHVAFSLSFMVANMLGKVLSPFYYSFLGKHFSIQDTGYYYQGNKWGETPNLLISSIIQGTTLSTLTPIQDDYPRFLNACRKTMSTLAFVLFPVSILAIAVAKPGFIYFLTDKWLTSVLYFQLLCFAGLFISLADMNVNFLNIKGKSQYALGLEIAKVSLAIIALLLTYTHGIIYIIYGQIAVRILVYLATALMSGKIYGYHLWAQLKDLLPSFGISLFAGVLAYLPLYFELISHNLLLVICQSLIFVAVYISINQLIKQVIWMEILGMLKKKFAK
ncbi:lipopolysaccharide biosynthesis protein [Sphingobacterium humi]|uniref:Oligosaccharide flippase family protein n=1 Tax=Sphingobacterium humi TaxID=1796905 RepID=A0A6N8L0Y0_9SPHI|nr:lipopolysaccharide biosynthesis protein [Sphingobacterium humi]MVZ61798.1 oligosaccharide flippase family protein [Sphingobacterium humi]